MGGGIFHGVENIFPQHGKRGRKKRSATGWAGGLGSELAGAEEDEGAGAEDGDAGGGEGFLELRIFGAGIEHDAGGLGGEDGIGHAGGVGGGDVEGDGVDGSGDGGEG